MNKLSKSITALRPEYDVVIIGSGYGGSIAASRFSRAGLKVCLLEKGKEFQPGDYPDTLLEAEKEMQINADKREAKKNGLLEFHISENISVFKGCGLGGTSLVNANVAIKPEPRVFEDIKWPSAIRNNMQSLEDGYQRANDMLKPAPYPVNTEGYPELNKTKAMKLSAEKMNQPFYYPNINVNFTVDGTANHVGVVQHKCINCGDCVTGCNHSAKNTLIMNYLPDAANHGAEIFCNVGVEYVAREADKWVVYFNVYNTDRDKFKAPPMFVRAANVIVSGGTLGSTEVLLRSAEKGLSISPMLGKGFSGNGDFLGFAYNCDEPINGIGMGKLSVKDHEPVGPCIASVIDMRNQPVLEDGMTLEEGSIPGPLGIPINLAMLALSKTIGIDTDKGFKDSLKETLQEAGSFFGGPYHGATNRMQTYLIMAHDGGKGEMSLKDGRLDIHWPKIGQEPIFNKASDAMQQATTALGGTYIRNVVWNKLLNYELVTVHPLGGCCMADDASGGVTNDIGNVYASNSGVETHPGLYVLDGSIVPRPLGTNPLFTISALTERSCKLILEQMGKTLSYDFPPVVPTVTQPAPAVQFTETMKGFFSKDPEVDFEKGYQFGKESASTFMFTLTIQTENVNTFINDPERKGYMAGTVIAPALSSLPLTISDGIFNLFVKDADNPEHKRMNYNMKLNSADGKQYYFKGYKKVENDKGFDVWSDTSTLYITVYDGENTEAPVLGKGILKIDPADLVTQMTTMKAINTTNLLDSLNALKLFSTIFSQNVIETYFRKLF
ncbi:MAG: GMC family oxidoreductase N-terminal domain-containing protein [Ferruginibacter sp.]